MTLRNIVRSIALSLLLSFASFSTHAQSMRVTPSHYLSAVSNNSTLVFPGPLLLQWIVAANTNASTIYYLKLYNKATAPTCGTDIPTLNIPIPPNNTGGGTVPIGVEGAQFPLGLGFCLTGALADNDNSNAATGVALNFGVVPQ
jgi:hypothetical protein